jgi:hypothetical protein
MIHGQLQLVHQKYARSDVRVRNDFSTLEIFMQQLITRSVSEPISRLLLKDLAASWLNLLQHVMRLSPNLFSPDLPILVLCP